MEIYLRCLISLVTFKNWYYDRAEKLYNVHGQRGEAPIEPKTTKDYPYPPVSHEPRMQEISDRVSDAGYNPFHLPLGLKLNEVDTFLSQCIRCDTYDGYPCMVHAKANGEVNGIRPALHYPNVTLLTGAKVERLHTSESGREVTEVRAVVNGHTEIFKSDLVVVSCGTINSAALLLRSANDRHPNGLANSSERRSVSANVD